ncbi:MAG: signal peptidase II [Deltaproteobacteria bacterium]|nr:signal peptidase II [Deltaproteobacteria bacterium]
METTQQPPRKVPGISARFVLVLIVLASSIGCDRATKLVAEDTLRGAGRISMLNDVFRFEFTRNQGAFLGMGAKLPEPVRNGIFIGGVSLLLLGLLAFALSRPHARAQLTALALIAGGGLGNLWDRIAGGAVTDFMNLGIGPVRTGIFNVADLAIVAGIALMVITQPRKSSLVEAGPPAGPGGPAA